METLSDMGVIRGTSIQELILLYKIRAIKLATQIGTQKCAERAVEAVDAAYAVRIFLWKFSAC